MKKKLGKAVLIFFVLMACCTVVSRSASSALTARIWTELPKKGTLTMRIQGEGTVTAGESYGQFLPEGQKVSKLLAEKGSCVQQGQELLLLDETYLREQIETASRESRKLQLQLEQQQLQGKSQARVPETAAAQIAVNSAEEAVKRAQEAYNEAVHEAQQFAATPPGAEVSKEETEQWNQTLDSLNETARGLADQVNEQAASYRQTVEQYHLAEQNEAKQRENEAAQAEANQLSVESIRLDLEQAQHQVEKLQEILDGGCLVKAQAAGVLMDPGVTEGTVTTGSEMLQIAGGSFYAEGTITKEEAGLLAVGDSVQVTFPGRSQPLSLTVEALGTKSFQTETGTESVNIWKGRLPEGEGVMGSVFSYQAEKKTEPYNQMVPLSAVREAQGKEYVLTVEERETVLGAQYIAVDVPVAVLEKDSEWAAVNGVLAPDAKLIVSSNKYVEEGDVVRFSE